MLTNSISQMIGVLFAAVVVVLSWPVRTKTGPPAAGRRLGAMAALRRLLTDLRGWHPTVNATLQQPRVRFILLFPVHRLRNSCASGCHVKNQALVELLLLLSCFSVSKKMDMQSKKLVSGIFDIVVVT